MRQYGAMFAFGLSLTIVGSAGVGAVRAQAPVDDADTGWADAAEVTLVFTGGNAEASTIGFKNDLARAWGRSTLLVAVGALRASSTKITRTAVGDSPASFSVVKNSLSDLTAESYFARTQYDRELSARTYWYAGTGWERNTFAGIQNRYSWGGGVGNTWIDDETSRLKTGYGVTYTLQDDVAPGVDSDEAFVGLRASYDYRRQLTNTTEFTSVLAVDENLEETHDFRADLINAVAVDISSRLALKVSWQLLFDDLPSLLELPLIGPTGVPSGETVFVELDSVDNLVTFALVASF